jgi:hypothetical protein
MVNLLIDMPKISNKPIKNSSPIKNRAINGAVLQLAIPKSTNVNSKGSIG